MGGRCPKRRLLAYVFGLRHAFDPDNNAARATSACAGRLHTWRPGKSPNSRLRGGD